MKGKNFSCNNLGQRRKADFYETPFSLTRHLLEREIFYINHVVLEPASGNGAITKVLHEKRNKVISFDIKDGDDFLKYNTKYKYIITNPPFSKAFEFIRQAKKICTNKFAFLLPLSYLHGKKRFDYIWQDKDFPLKKIYVFTRYPMLGDPLFEDGKYRTGMMVYAWFIWEKEYQDKPAIDWIDNNFDVIGQEEFGKRIKGLNERI